MTGDARRKPRTRQVAYRNPLLTTLWSYPRLTVGSLLLAILVALSVCAPLLASYGPTEQHLSVVLQGPSDNYLLGTDQLGRDLVSRTLYGGRLALAVAVATVLLAVAAGVLLGLLAGYRGGIIDAVIMRVMDGVIVFPELVLALAITYALGPSFANVVAAIAIVNVPKFARVVRGQVLSLREREFVASAVVAGASTTRILSRHLLPNVLEVTVVQAALTGGMAIFTAASLSFLGLGLPPPAPDWGGMLRDGYAYIEIAPLLAIVPGCFVFAAMLSFNLIGDGLRDFFDPRVVPRVQMHRPDDSDPQADLVNVEADESGIKASPAGALSVHRALMTVRRVFAGRSRSYEG